MVQPTLFFWLLVTRLGPHAYSQGAPDQENHPTSANLLAPPTFLNNSRFAFSLYRRMVAANPGKNIIFSPLSFSIPFTLLALQAGPAVCTQVLEALGFPLAQVPGHGVHAHYSQRLLASLRSLAACQPHVGSILFVDERQHLAQRFVDIAQNLYGTEVFLIPFGNKQVAREQMDHVASKMTHYEIRKLAQELTPDTVLILANYIFFKGMWKIHFDPKLTEIRPFSVREGVKVLVPMMQRPGWFQLQRFDHLHGYVLRLPCTCHATAVFILPDAGVCQKQRGGGDRPTPPDSGSSVKQDPRGFTSALKTGDPALDSRQVQLRDPQPLQITKGCLAMRLLDSLHSVSAHHGPDSSSPCRRRLYFPKFTLSGTSQLEQFLPSMGMPGIFSYRAGITGISLQSITMKISRAVHRAELTMDETGAEAEDTSAFRFLPRSHSPPFHFNRPFLLLMFKEGSGNLLFMGKVMNPIAKS
ncbi:alpha-1-antitrypsin-like [Meles meles]|uniref:alpha-1-antitrypsin-like n=1 Tax=Meles meles TaxID=9662 RepID=UPI001E69BA73|nr:alpha-1-antitrypsin-like [Meles meles]